MELTRPRFFYSGCDLKQELPKTKHSASSPTLCRSGHRRNCFPRKRSSAHKFRLPEPKFTGGSSPAAEEFNTMGADESADHFFVGWRRNSQRTVHHKSKDIKIKLMDSAARAANLQIQAETARTRLTQKVAALIQAERREPISGNEKGIEGFMERLKSLMEQYEDQVSRKEMSAELDCRFARGAIHSLPAAERQDS